MPVSLRQVGPGIVIAATGLGAGDLIAASVAGARYDYALLWAALLGAILKFALNEGLARWQLTTGTTLLEGWRQRLPAVVSWYFLAYLLVWTVVVAAALMAACGLATHALFPSVGVTEAAIGHSLLALVFVLTGRYRWLEPVMKFLILLMFVVVLACAWQIFPGWASILKGLFVPAVPQGSTWFLLGVIGGVGGSVTLLSYGYWIRERGWTTADQLPQVRLDLFVAYAMTAVFAIAVMLISAGVQPEVMQGSNMVLSVASHLGSVVGDTGQSLFLIGFWAAVFSSMLGVWQGVPYLFCDFLQAGKQQAERQPIETSCLSYRSYLVFMALVPMVLVNVGKPVWLVVLYAVVGAMFMPLLAVLLLYMNNRRSWMGVAANGKYANTALGAALVLFGVLLVQKIQANLQQI
jgi:Mn2+/Fe2+ NRAMP family transporter